MAGERGIDGKKRGKKENGRLLMGRTWAEVPAPAVNAEIRSLTR